MLSSPNFICSHVPVEIFIFHKNRKEEGNEKRDVFLKGDDVRVLIVCSPGVWEHPREHPWVSLPQENTLVVAGQDSRVIADILIVTFDLGCVPNKLLLT